MEIFGDLPWAVPVLALLAAALLIVLNLGWLLAARAMLEGWRRNGRTAPGARRPSARNGPGTRPAESRAAGGGPRDLTQSASLDRLE